MKATYHKEIFRKTFEIIRPIGSRPIPLNGAKYADTPGANSGPVKTSNGGAVTSVTTQTGTGGTTSGGTTSGGTTQPAYILASDSFTFEELRFEAAKLLIDNKNYNPYDFSNHEDELKEFSAFLMLHGGKAPTGHNFLGSIRNTGIKHLIIAINNADNTAELKAAMKDYHIMSATYTYPKHKVD